MNEDKILFWRNRLKFKEKKKKKSELMRDRTWEGVNRNYLTMLKCLQKIAFKDTIEILRYYIFLFIL